jgi:hypothetical protein
MSSPHGSGDAFAAITDQIAVLAHALRTLHADVTAWPDHAQGLRADTPGTNTHPDVLARTAAERLDVAAQALTYLSNTVDAAWAAAAPLYLADDQGENSETRDVRVERS